MYREALFQIKNMNATKVNIVFHSHQIMLWFIKPTFISVKETRHELKSSFNVLSFLIVSLCNIKFLLRQMKATRDNAERHPGH